MDWKYADHISDRIIDLLNAERKHPAFNPTQMFAGQLCAMIALLRTAEGLSQPPAIIEVRAAIEKCLRTMINENAPPRS